MRPATRSASGTSVTPFQGRRAALQVLDQQAAVHRPGAWTTATRSSGTPSSAARSDPAHGGPDLVVLVGGDDQLEAGP